mmetsp:Transcript_25650/g.71754  ORF Transcript_25650/g.71754 Transcript_25650/m.71754 type:complete len:139 (-) Transcript_25650:1205-1621(-)
MNTLLDISSSGLPTAVDGLLIQLQRSVAEFDSVARRLENDIVGGEESLLDIVDRIRRLERHAKAAAEDIELLQAAKKDVLYQLQATLSTSAESLQRLGERSGQLEASPGQEGEFGDRSPPIQGLCGALKEWGASQLGS